MIEVIGIDADDTLWQNEEFFRAAQTEIKSMLSPFLDIMLFDDELLKTERRNIPIYGYGIKGFILSTLETANTLSNGKLPAAATQEILTLGRKMLAHPIVLLGGVRQTLPLLAETYELCLITKGDLLHQEQKIEASGLAPYFDGIKIVSEKTDATYIEIFGERISKSVMVGNSMKSDIAPALAAGAAAIHIPAQFEWTLEKAHVDAATANLFRVESFADIASVLPKIR